RWQKIFMIPLWSKVAVFWNKMFLTIIVLLIVLFLDAVREVKKYSVIHVNEKAANVNSSAFDHIQMKLFRSQRNLYLSGFSLFLWLVLRRTITLLNQLAKEMASHAALEMQVNDATEAAKKYLAKIERPQETYGDFLGKGDAMVLFHFDSFENDAKSYNKTNYLQLDMRSESERTLHKANIEVAAVKKQSESLKREYDNLMKEYEQLQ
ncbi:BAP29 protein, partial [Probosciger aterrimus]|nr:BAP29 protein [Probosciger aterrimus]